MYRLRLLVNGKPIPVYQGNDGKHWVEARENTKFKIKIENDHYNRILAVVSVDGLNVINAKHEDPMEKALGYVINANSNLKIPGWLIDNEKAKQFVFASENNSYTRKIGADESNIGVIGVAIISEKPYITTNIWQNPITIWTNENPYIYPGTTGPYWNTCETATTTNYNANDSGNFAVSSSLETSGNDNSSLSSTAFNMSVSSGPREKVSAPLELPKKLSVGSGKKTNFSTTEVNFTKGSLETVLTFYYDTRENLIKRGIITDAPKPFPISGNYCPDV